MSVVMLYPEMYKSADNFSEVSLSLIKHDLASIFPLQRHFAELSQLRAGTATLVDAVVVELTTVPHTILHQIFTLSVVAMAVNYTSHIKPNCL